MNDERPRNRGGDQPNLAWSQVPEGDPRSRAPRAPQGDRRPPQAGPPPGRRPLPPLPPRPSAPPPPPRAPGPTLQGTPTQPPPEWAPRQIPEPIPADRVRRPADPRVDRVDRGGRVPPPRRPRDGRPAPEPAAAPPAKPRRKRKLHVFRWLTLLVVLLLAAVVAGTFYFDGKLKRIDALVAYDGRVGDTPGTNWLLVGTDAREGLTPEQQRELATGGDLGGARTDTIMLVHIPRSGTPLLISIPRDLYVPIPGHGDYKINAAYFFGNDANGDSGGARLLVQTFESKAHVHIDHYAEIGFGGFATMVDALGGIEMCPKYPINDPKAGVKLKAGCQTLDGAQALGYVRTRATPNADLDRVVHQREFMTALFHEATSAGTLVNPFALWKLTNAAVGALTVDTDTHVWDLARLAWAMGSSPITTTTPTGGNVWTNDGAALAWGDDTTEFFGLLASDQPIPDRLLSTPPAAG